MLNSFLTSQKERVLSIHFSDSKQVTIFQKHNTETVNWHPIGGGWLNKSMSGGGVGLWAATWRTYSTLKCFAPQVKRKIDQKVASDSHLSTTLN